VAVDAGGNVFVTGSSIGNGSGYDYLTIKYSPTGVALWTNRYNGPGHGQDRANAIAVDGNGRVFVTGSSAGTNSYGFLFLEYATIAYSSAGLPLWTNRFHGPQFRDEEARAVAVDESVIVFVTGYSYGQMGDSDFTTIAYSAAGPALWTNRYDSPINGLGSDDQPLTARSMAVAGNGSVVVVGRSGG